MEIRILNVMRDSNTDRETSENYVYKTEADRNAFHHKHFRANWSDPGHYDLIVNAGSLGIEGAVTVVFKSGIWLYFPFSSLACCPLVTVI